MKRLKKHANCPNTLRTTYSTVVSSLHPLCTEEKFERYLADLRQRIIEEVELITPHMLINTWQELEYHLDICRATTGAHIEVCGRA